jgi:hypothetical protein
MVLNGGMADLGETPQPLLPEWEQGAEVDDATWIAALEASRRRQFEELADL